MASSLGSFTFVTFDPKPITAQPGVALESRAGVAGHAAWLTGTRGQTSQHQTVTAVADWATAVTLAALYEAAVGSVLAASFGGVSCGNQLVLGVKAEPEAIVQGVGEGYGFTALCRATWTLVAWT